MVNGIHASKEVLSKNLLYKQQTLGISSLAAYGCRHIPECTAQRIFACSICMHLQSAPTYTEMHGEVRTPVSQTQRLAVVRGCEVQAGNPASDSVVTAMVEYFHNAARGEGSAED